MWTDDNQPMNRSVTVDGSKWKDKEFKNWQENADDDVLGYMHAKKASLVRRSILEITRAVSTTPWPGDVSFNFASPGANPSVKHGNPTPYAVEIHDTRYQYSIAMTPEKLADSSRASIALTTLVNLRRVAGNHTRFLFDFSPESIVFRITDDPAPRILYCFTQDEYGAISAPALVKRVESGDIPPGELIIGGVISETPDGEKLKHAGVNVIPGVVKALEAALEKLD